MGEIHFHPSSDDVRPEPIIHTLLDRKDQIKSLFCLVDYEDGTLEFIHSTVKKRDLSYYKDLIIKYVFSRI